MSQPVAFKIYLRRYVPSPSPSPSLTPPIRLRRRPIRLASGRVSPNTIVHSASLFCVCQHARDHVADARLSSAPPSIPRCLSLPTDREIDGVLAASRRAHTAAQEVQPIGGEHARLLPAGVVPAPARHVRGWIGRRPLLLIVSKPRILLETSPRCCRTHVRKSSGRVRRSVSWRAITRLREHESSRRQVAPGAVDHGVGAGLARARGSAAVCRCSVLLAAFTSGGSDDVGLGA